MNKLKKDYAKIFTANYIYLENNLSKWFGGAPLHILMNSIRNMKKNYFSDVDNNYYSFTKLNIILYAVQCSVQEIVSMKCKIKNK